MVSTTLEFLFSMIRLRTTMRSLYIIGIVTLYMTIDSDAEQGLSHYKNTRISEDESERSLQFVVDLARNFSSYYFQQATAFVPHDRIVAPLNIFFTLSMLAYGAQGFTRNKLLNALGLPEDETRMAQTGLKGYLDKLAEHGVRMETRIFTPPSVNLNRHFVTLSKNVFHSQYGSVQVKDGFLDSQSINEWVAARTKDNVKELFEPQFVGPNPKIVIASTVSFNATWETTFDPSRTELSPFRTLDGKSIELETMHTNGRFCIGRNEELKASFLKLPCKGGAMSMLVLLPDKSERNEWVHFVHGLRTIKLSSFLNCTEREVEVSLPKFKVQTTMSMDDALKKIIKPELSLTTDRVDKPLSSSEFREQMFFHLRLSDRIETTNFRLDLANLSGIFESPGGSRLGKTAMKVVIDVNEGGQVAAGSHGISYRKVNSTQKSAPLDRKARSTIPEPPLLFTVDHPFVALVMTDGNFRTDVFSVYFGGEDNRPKERRSRQNKKKRHD